MIAPTASSGMMLFPIKDPMFTIGFHCGRAWEAMQQKCRTVCVIAPAAAHDTLVAMAMQMGYTDEITDVGGGRVEAKFELI